LQNQIDTRSRGAHLHVASQMREAEHVGFHHPGSGRDTCKLKCAVFVCQRDQAALPLSSTNAGSGNRLTIGLHRAGLRQDGRPGSHPHQDPDQN
jgi:hypothetical protein